ncbi:hypothetical protein BDR04DRAFT_1149842 [Suillus decipiens]|nr:hypothetical protein BDR04DRAFT_1149842 [Suillus decipiens]
MAQPEITSQANNAKAHWQDIEVDVLLHYLIENRAVGGDGGNFTMSTFNVAAAAINADTAIQTIGPQKTAQKIFNQIEIYCNISGSHWDNEQGAGIEGTAAASVWDTYVNPKGQLLAPKLSQLPAPKKAWMSAHGGTQAGINSAAKLAAKITSAAAIMNMQGSINRLTDAIEKNMVIPPELPVPTVPTIISRGLGIMHSQDDHLTAAQRAKSIQHSQPDESTWGQPAPLWTEAKRRLQSILCAVYEENKKKEETEMPAQWQSCQSCEHAVMNHSIPSKSNSHCFEWQPDGDFGGLLQCICLIKAEIPMAWMLYNKSTRVYDLFCNKWDLCEALDPASVPDGNWEEDNFPLPLPPLLLLNPPHQHPTPLSSFLQDIKTYLGHYEVVPSAKYTQNV